MESIRSRKWDPAKESWLRGVLRCSRWRGRLLPMGLVNNSHLDSSRHGLSDVDKKLILTYDNRAKTDGVGAQLQRIYGIYSISRLLGARYLHSPLGCVNYQGLAALEGNVSDPGFHHEFNDIFQIKSDDFVTDDFHTIELPNISM